MMEGVTGILVLVLFCGLLYFLKNYLLKVAFNRRRNVFFDPEELARLSIEKHQKQNKAAELFKFRSFSQIEKLFKMNLSVLLYVREAYSGNN